jgi:hypothetical protein
MYFFDIELGKIYLRPSKKQKKSLLAKIKSLWMFGQQR